MKCNLRAEGPSDYDDMTKSMGYPPVYNFIDMASQVASYTNRRTPGFYCPYDGRVAEPSEENIQAAIAGTLKVNAEDLVDRENPLSPHCLNPQHNTTSCLCLFDKFHEGNSSYEEDYLRRLRNIPALNGEVNTSAAEQGNWRSRQANYFLNMMNFRNHVFWKLIIEDLNNRKINKRLSKNIADSFGVALDQLTSNKFGQLCHPDSGLHPDDASSNGNPESIPMDSPSPDNTSFTVNPSTPQEESHQQQTNTDGTLPNDTSVSTTKATSPENKQDKPSPQALQSKRSDNEAHLKSTKQHLAKRSSKQEASKQIAIGLC